MAVKLFAKSARNKKSAKPDVEKEKFAVTGKAAGPVGIVSLIRSANTRVGIRTKILVLVAFVTVVLSVLNTAIVQNMWNNQKKTIDWQFGEIITANAKTLSEKVERHFEKLKSLAMVPDVAVLELDELLPYLKSPLDDRGHFIESTAVINPDGSSISAEGTKANLGDRDYFKAIMSGSERVISDPVVSKFSNSPVVLLCVPVKKDGKVVRELHGRIDLNKFYDGYISNLKYGNYGSTAVLNTKGIIIAHPEKELMMKKYDDETVPSEMRNVYQEILDSKTGRIDYRKDGKTYTAYYRLVPETNWILVMSVSHDETFALMKKLRATAIVSQVILLAAFLVASLLLVGTALRPLRDLSEASKRVASGKLDFEFRAETREDEVGKVAGAFGEMLVALREMVANLKNKSEELSATAEQLAANAEQTSGSSLKIASVVQQVSAIAENVAGDVKKVDAEAEAASNMIKSGQTGLREVSFQMEKINAFAERIKAVMGDLKVAAGQIGKMVEVITEIADQTKLLSLNAAIEAARAGEHGRGFAVVASEVKKLSDGASDSAKQIKEIIRAVESKVAEIGTVVENAVVEIEDGVQTVASVDGTFTSLFGELNELIAQFSSAVSQVEEISRSIQDVSGTAQESLAMAQEVNSSAEVLNKVVTELDLMVSRFKV